MACVWLGALGLHLKRLELLLHLVGDLPLRSLVGAARRRVAGLDLGLGLAPLLCLGLAPCFPLPLRHCPLPPALALRVVPRLEAVGTRKVRWTLVEEEGVGAQAPRRSCRTCRTKAFCNSTTGSNALASSSPSLTSLLALPKGLKRFLAARQ